MRPLARRREMLLEEYERLTGTKPDYCACCASQTSLDGQRQSAESSAENELRQNLAMRSETRLAAVADRREQKMGAISTE
jgi:hypothetical protein